MFSFSDKCIFCDKPLPELRKGEGEHVIPKSIYGFWRSLDICEECILLFGNEVDPIAIKNVDILNAMKSLGYPEVDSYFEALPYIAKDVDDQRSIKMIGKDGKLRSKVVKTDVYLECPKGLFDRVCVPWILKNEHRRIKNSKLQAEIKRLQNEVSSANTGDLINSPILGYPIRIRGVNQVGLDINSIPSITRLIAKIVVCFLFYFRDFVSVGELSEMLWYHTLKEHALKGVELEQNVINWAPLTHEIPYRKFHRIRIESFFNSLIINVTLFNYPNWRIVMPCYGKVKIVDLNLEEAKRLYYIMDFEDLEDREKIISFKLDNKDSIDEYTFDL